MKKTVGILNGVFLLGMQAVLSMLRTKYIIQGFGSEINAIGQSAKQVFNYFILFESGMGAAYLYKMYEPMAIRDNTKIASLYNALSISMKKIAVKMLLAVFPLAVLYAAVMNRKEADYLTAVLIILLLGLRFVIPYYVSVSKKSLLNLFEYKYLIDIVDSFADILITLIEIFLIVYLKRSIIEVLCVGCAINILFGYIYTKLIQKLCKQALDSDATPNFEAEKLTKSILVHNITGLVNSNIDVFLLSIVNIQAVTVYQAYSSVYNYPILLINRISENFRAGIGIRMAKQDGHVYKEFQQLLAFQMFSAIVITAVFIMSINSFVRLWIGAEFTLGKTAVYLFAAYIIHKIICSSIFIVRDGKGLYEESKKFTIQEAFINLFLSIILVKKFEIEGVMLATVIPVYLCLMPRNIKLIFQEIFHRKSYLFIDYFVVFGGVFFSVVIYSLCFSGYVVCSWGQLIVSAGIQTLISSVMAVVILGIYKFQYFRRD